jgi:hypothetical protein
MEAGHAARFQNRRNRIMPSSKASAKASTNVLVTVDEGYRGQLDAVAGRLESAGMKVAERFELGGIFVGEVSLGNLAKLRAVKGIKAVEEEPIFHTGG